VKRIRYFTAAGELKQSGFDVTPESNMSTGPLVVTPLSEYLQNRNSVYNPRAQ
jgi:hypothetical protein